DQRVGVIQCDIVAAGDADRAEVVPCVGQGDVIRCTCCKGGRASDRYHTALGNGTGGGDVEVASDIRGADHEGVGIVVLDVAGRVGGQRSHIIRVVRESIGATTLEAQR